MKFVMFLGRSFLVHAAMYSGVTAGAGLGLVLVAGATKAMTGKIVEDLQKTVDLKKIIETPKNETPISEDKA